MNISALPSNRVDFTGAACVVVPVFEDGDSPKPAVLREADAASLQTLVRAGRISGKAQAINFVPVADAPYAAFMTLGLGKRNTFSAESLRRAAGAACEAFSKQRIDHVVFDSPPDEPMPVEALVEGVILGQYSFDAYKKKADEPRVDVSRITIVADADSSAEIQSACERAAIICANANWARDLGCMPPNDLTPPVLAARAKAMTKEVGAECTILDVDDMRRLGMNALLGVARGSSKAPKMIIAKYTHPDAKKTLALVGKGVTFDTGGISIKPAGDMHEMKYDMCGAAAVLGAFKSICELGPAVNVVCVVPSAENKTGADAQRPGDIVRAYNGKTIEVLNTDAEGRLILADALAYTAEQFKPDAMVDAATLTGAVVVALGHYAAGVMATDEALLDQLQLAADATAERIWPLPLWDDYAKLLESPHADLANIGPRGVGGAVIAGCFLKEFVGDTPWAHVDIAGTAWGVANIPYWNKQHPTGYGVRLFTHWILNQTAA